MFSSILEKFDFIGKTKAKMAFPEQNVK